ncbi:hypothetical protein KMZ32_08475 [Phycicoccus sp. MAQZ13P-2]|uniref:hypothetical protein n=1 Tax=Phycicoccus mangrovi TaxID=2840470 RepID=UPI001BFFD9B0|nr:hypothetical protein [Phycicoccus mangrovi]MBT9255121.1 hypothetical protein [Phycicoccus mangrovi]MBT9274105.1 hypothetical protein [Phycicoccus mangrovi]
MSSIRPARRAAAGLATASVVALALAACGGSSTDSSTAAATATAAASSSAPSTSAPAEPEQPSMGELYTKVRTASLAAESGHLDGKVTQGGETVALEIEGQADGSNQKTTIGIGKGTAEILTVKKKYYMSADKAFWTEQTGDASAAKLLVGKYVAISGSDAKQFGDLTLGALLDQMFEESELSTLEKLTSDVETRTEDGKEVWVASDGSGSEIWVDPTSERLVKIVVGGKDAGELTFDSWDDVDTFSAPPASKVVTP